jgi:nitrogen-specific signal transduction histidine kinase
MQNSFDIALKNISSKLLITDKSFNVVFINSSAEDFLNINFSKYEGKSVDKIFTEKPDNSLELSELAASKTHLKRHITTLFLNNNLKKKCSFLATYYDEAEEFIVF